MLGDTGANALGAALGLAAVTTYGRFGRLAHLAGLVAATLASEKISFTELIARTPCCAGSTSSAAGRADPRHRDGAPVMTRRRVVRGLAGAALLIAVVTAVSRVVGFGRVLVFSKTVGDTCLGDVYNTANLLPNVAFEVVAGGALASVVVPLLVGRFDRGEHAEASQTLSALLTWTLRRARAGRGAPGRVRRPVVAFFLGGDEVCGPEAVEVGARMLRIFAPQIPLYGAGCRDRRRAAGPSVLPARARPHRSSAASS